MKRPLEQTSQPESKRMSLGEDPSVEHGILAAEDCRNNDHEKYGTHRRAGIQMRQKREGQCLPSCAQDDVVEVAFA